jgi:hypothetical protein
MCQETEAHGNLSVLKMASMAFGGFLSPRLFQSTVVSSVERVGSTRHVLRVRNVYRTKEKHATLPATHFDGAAAMQDSYC